MCTRQRISVEIGHQKMNVMIKDNVSEGEIMAQPRSRTRPSGCFSLLHFFYRCRDFASQNQPYPQDRTNYPQFHKHAFRGPLLCLWRRRARYLQLQRLAGQSERPWGSLQMEMLQLFVLLGVAVICPEPVTAVTSNLFLAFVLCETNFDVRSAPYDMVSKVTGYSGL